MDAALVVENEFLRQQMEHFAIRRQGNSAGLVYGLTNFVAADLSRAITEYQAAMRIDSPHVRTSNTQNCVLNGNAGTVFCLLDGFLNRSDSLLQIDNDALARASRSHQPMTSIAQPVLCDFSDQHTGLCAADINRSQEIFVRLRHRYGFPCPFAMAGLGFWSAGLACNLEMAGAGFATPCAAHFAAPCFHRTPV